MASSSVAAHHNQLNTSPFPNVYEKVWWPLVSGAIKMRKALSTASVLVCPFLSYCRNMATQHDSAAFVDTKGSL